MYIPVMYKYLKEPEMTIKIVSGIL